MVVGTLPIQSILSNIFMSGQEKSAQDLIFNTPASNSNLIGNQRNQRKSKITYEENQITEQSLRRSKRLQNKNKGCKNRTILESVGAKSNKSANKRKIAGSRELFGKIKISAADPDVEFPGLKDLQEIETYPDISISKIQDVAINKCGIPPLEVTEDILLAETQEIQGSVNINTQTLTNENE